MLHMNTHTTPLKRWLALLVPASIVLSADQLAKSLVASNLAVGQTVVPIPVLSDYFMITHSRNTGAAFSMLPQAGDLFLLVAIGMVVGIFFFYRKMPIGHGHWIERIALGMLLGGTLGNAIDRLTRGYVVDWVHLRLPGVISNVSNFADHAIVLGIGIVFLMAWRNTPANADDKPQLPTEPTEGNQPQPSSSVSSSSGDSSRSG